ncbi:uncharacterized protein FFB14_09688 [Fusarium fujikuroi]|nr:uncharacterized protein FFB14_09688 [Fusarium fujikuroi]
MCPTTFVEYYCNEKKCDYFIGYKQRERDALRREEEEVSASEMQNRDRFER